MYSCISLGSRGWVRLSRTLLCSMSHAVPEVQADAGRSIGVWRGCRSTRPLDLQRLEAGGPLWFVLVNPRFEAPTVEMRAVLPREVPMAAQIHNAAMGGSLVRPGCLGPWKPSSARGLIIVAVTWIAS